MNLRVPIQGQGLPPGKQKREPGEVMSGKKAMVSLHALLVLFLLHMLLSGAFSVPLEHPEDKNAEIVQVNELSLR